MLKADAKRFENLAAADESVRVEAAVQLQRQKRNHFYDHPVGKFRFSPEQVASLLSAWHATSSELLKVWIAQALALTQTGTPEEVLTVLADALRFDGPYMPAVAEFLRGNLKRIPDGNQLFRSLHRHPNPEVRWRSAVVLESMGYAKELDYARDMPILRALMLDTHASPRLTAVQAAAKMPGLGPADYEVLLDVANIDSGAARHYARELMAKLEGTVPGCTPSAFAPREPLLRTDGVYHVDKAELDAEGVWVSRGCLRFFSDAAVHYFGTNEAPVDFPRLLPGREPKVARGTVKKQGARVSFSVAGCEGTVDYEGHIDGDKLHLRSMHRGTGRRADESYTWMYIDWNAAPAEAPVPAKKSGGTGKDRLPFVPVRPQSMLISDAAKWYVQMLARLPGMLEGARDEAEKLVLGWHIKRDIRDTAARAQYDPALKEEFFAKMPLPPLEELQGQDPAAALATLLTVTQAEVRAFPGTIGEAIGMEYWNGRQSWVMTEQGWAPKD